jgi:hypothetical protein
MTIERIADKVRAGGRVTAEELRRRVTVQLERLVCRDAPARPHLVRDLFDHRQ